MRIGLGFDLHRIKKAPKGSLLLAGVRIAAPYKVDAHSDGDLVYHALSDAILSAMGLGDIGEKFPPGKIKTKSMDSLNILQFALSEMKQKFCRLESASIVVAAQEPKFSAHRGKIQESLAKSLSLKAGRVGVTFKTFEGLEPFSKNAIACWANCLIQE